MPDPSPASSLRVARVILLKCQSAIGTPLLSELHWPTGSLRWRPRPPRLPHLLVPSLIFTHTLWPPCCSSKNTVLSACCTRKGCSPPGSLQLFFTTLWSSSASLSWPCQCSPPTSGTPSSPFFIVSSLVGITLMLLFSTKMSAPQGQAFSVWPTTVSPCLGQCWHIGGTEYIFVGREFNCSSDRIGKLTLPCAVSNPLLFSPMTFTAALGVEALLSSF